MKHKILTVLYFIAFAIPIPIAIIGCLWSMLWGIAAGVEKFEFIQVILAVLGVVIGGTYINTYVYAISVTRKEKKFSRKTLLPLAHCLVAALYLLSIPVAGIVYDRTQKHFGFAKKDFIVVEESDTHGGFLGDGTYYLKLDCSHNTKKAMKNLKGWNNLPMSLPLDSYLFDGGMGLADSLGVPVITNGYYMFEDRHSESTDPTDESQLRIRASRNFSVAIYDSDTDTFYFIADDT